MTRVYDNWERLVTAVLRREDLWLTGLRTPSDVSSLSSPSASASPSFNFSSNPPQVSPLSSSNLFVGQSFTYNQILEATDCLSDSNLIKHGHSKRHYYGIMEGGIQVVVKRIDLSCIENESCFMSELEVCGLLRHYRIVALLGHCLENGYEKFLVYKYAPNKDLASYLWYDVAKESSLDWSTRLKIAIGAAEGLCYLHHECFPPIVHRDIQASSILLDDDFEVQLGSLSTVRFEEKDSNRSRIARFLQLSKGVEQTTSGTSTARCSYDVYCFGKVLLELITGKLVIGAANDSCVKNSIEYALRYVVSNDKKLILKIVDRFLITDEHLLEEVWAVAFVAKACVQRKPSKRPQMREILDAMIDIQSTRFGPLQTAGNPSKSWPVPTVPAVSERPKTIGIQSTRFGQLQSAGNSSKSWPARTMPAVLERPKTIGIQSTRFGQLQPAKNHIKFWSAPTTPVVTEGPKVGIQSTRFGQLQPAENPKKSWPAPTIPTVLEGYKTIGIQLTRFGQLQRAGNPSKSWPPPTIPAVPEGPKARGIQSTRFGQLQPARNPIEFCPSPTMPVVPEGPKVIGASREEETNAEGELLASNDLRIFSLSELKVATRNFAALTLLESNEFGMLHVGSIKASTVPTNKSLIAVRRLYPEIVQEFHEWQFEVNSIGRLSHPNIIKLIGYCREDEELLLVHEFLLLGSLDKYLFGTGTANHPLSWDIRLKILTGAARGLAFLHTSGRQGLLNRKKGNREGFYLCFDTSDILLDHSYHAKISGVNPEYMGIGDIYLEGDVYGFGIVMVEMLTGLQVGNVARQVEEFLQVYMFKPYLANRRMLDKIMDSRLQGKYPAETALEVSKLALICLDQQPKLRPSMQEVVEALEKIQSIE